MGSSWELFGFSPLICLHPRAVIGRTLLLQPPDSLGRPVLPRGGATGNLASSWPSSERERHMEFFSSWYFIGIMAFLLVALVGLLIFLRMKPPAE